MNPYEVLGVNPNDDEETIKKAYRTLVKKYHPDRYANSPMAEQASEKLKEINLAYDMICSKAEPEQNTGYGGYQSGGYGYGGGAQFDVSFQSVRMLITMRQFGAAEAMLAQLPHNAEWNYLMGVIYLNRGWYAKAKEFIERAVSLDPGNGEYRATLSSFSTRGQDYRSFGTNIHPLACCLPTICCSNLLCRGCFCC